MFLTLALQVFYLIAIYHSFQAYKEFKGMVQDLGDNGKHIIESNNFMSYGTLDNIPADNGRPTGPDY